jgi:hypothetical protein
VWGDMKIKLWPFLGIYGVWFAIFSGIQEILAGVYWKAAASLVLALAVYWSMERR